MAVVVPGARLGPYEIISLLGRGGMGQVYRARDVRLGRDVAIKVLPQAFAADIERVRRFEREARAVAAIQHPHICALYDVGHQDDIRFLVMELVDGDTLEDVLSTSEPLPLHQILGYSIEIAEALAEAHRAGIVHRDLKPSNIMITRSGIKLLDFGIAKVQPAGNYNDSSASTETAVTALGNVMGTLRYMSPEQLGGGTIDCRCDVFAFGAVVYEMATGVPAFAGGSPAAVVAAILEHEPAEMTTLQPHLSHALSRLVKRCLAKQPADRFQSIREPAEHLRIIARGVPSGEADLRQQKARTAARRRSRIRSIAVLPLEDFSCDPQQFFSDGMTEALTATLASLPSLRVISRTSAMRYRGVRRPMAEIGRELGVAGVLEGSIVRSGERVRLMVQLIDASTDTHLWAGTFDRDFQDLLTLQDEFAMAVAREIQLNVTAASRQTLQSRKIDPAAHEAYLRGRYLLERETGTSLQQSRKYLQDAATLAPRFAPTYVALAHWYFTAALHGLVDAAEAHQRAASAAETASGLDPSLAAAHAILGEVALVHWRFAEAERLFRKAVRIGPNDAWSVRRFGRFLMIVGKPAEAIEVNRFAHRLDPLSVNTVAGLGAAFYSARQFQDAIAYFDKALEIDRDSPRLLYQKGMAFTLLGSFADAFSCFERAASTPELTAYTRSALTAAKIYAHARSGQRKRAEELLAEFEPTAFEPTNLAEAYAGLGNVSKVVEHLEIAARDGALHALDAKCDPLYDTVRCEDEFQQFLKRIRLPD